MSDIDNAIARHIDEAYRIHKPHTPEIINAAVRQCAAHANDSDELRIMLQRLGILDSERQPDRRCGTDAGVMRHRRLNEPMCDDCLRWRRHRQNITRFLAGITAQPARCRWCGSIFSQHRCFGPTSRKTRP